MTTSVLFSQEDFSVSKLVPKQELAKYVNKTI